MLAGHLVPAGSMFAFLAAHRAEVFPDADYADLFAPPGFGRPSLPATQMAAVLTLQALHDYLGPGDRRGGPVRRAVEGGHAGWRWMTRGSTRRRWCTGGTGSRSRSARTGSTTRSRRWWRRPGCCEGRRRRAVDSTILADAVATQDTVTQLVSAIRRVAREVPGAAEQIAAVCTGHDYSKPGKPKIDWDDPAAKDALVSALVNDANALVEAFAGRGAG